MSVAACQTLACLRWPVSLDVVHEAETKEKNTVGTISERSKALAGAVLYCKPERRGCLKRQESRAEDIRRAMMPPPMDEDIDNTETDTGHPQSWEST